MFKEGRITEATEIPAANIPKLDLLYAVYCVSKGQMSSTSDMFIRVWKLIQFPKVCVSFGF
jgi:hypothetical protein